MIQHERNYSDSDSDDNRNPAEVSSIQSDSPVQNPAEASSNQAEMPGQSSPVSKKAYAAVLLVFIFAATIFYTAACSLMKSGPAAPTEEIQGPTEEKQPPTEEKQTPSEAELPASDEPVAPVFVRPARFLTDVCLTRSGDLWVTAEAGGVFRLHDPDTDKEWEDMRAQPGFPKTDNCTVVCEDSQGRIWVGTASMGVQVYNGRSWRRYDRDTVLSGSHIHDLASSESGLTAVAHEYGVSVYDSQSDSWRDYTVLNGLPSGGVRGVCFGPGDKLHCATETGG